MRPLYCFVGAPLLFLTSSCSIYDASLIREGDASIDRDAGLEGYVGRRPPTRPDVADGEDGPVRVFALGDVVLAQSPARWSTIGYDLDGFYTRQATDPVECVPKPDLDAKLDFSERPPNVQLDGEDGIDNVFGAALYDAVKLGLTATGLFEAGEDPDIEREARTSHRAGRGTLLVRITGWNGTPNDPRVQVEVAQSVFATACEGGTPPSITYDSQTQQPRLQGGDPLPPPAWEGFDCYWMRPDSFPLTLERSFLNDDDAYVSEGTLVFHLPEREILFFADPVAVPVVLSDNVFTMDLGEDGAGNLIAAGRWTINDLNRVGPHIGICPGSTQALLESTLHRLADLRQPAPAPGGERRYDIACNALSIGVLFETAVPATWVGKSGVPGPMLPNFCGEQTEPTEGPTRSNEEPSAPDVPTPST